MSRATNPNCRTGEPLREWYPLSFLFGLAPSGVFRASFVTKRAVRFYRPVSPLPLVRVAVAITRQKGGLFSVVLSLGFPLPAVSWHCSPVEPGLSSIILQ